MGRSRGKWEDMRGNDAKFRDAAGIAPKKAAAREGNRTPDVKKELMMARDNVSHMNDFTDAGATCQSPGLAWCLASQKRLFRSVGARFLKTCSTRVLAFRFSYFTPALYFQPARRLFATVAHTQT